MYFLLDLVLDYPNKFSSLIILFQRIVLKGRLELDLLAQTYNPRYLLRKLRKDDLEGLSGLQNYFKASGPLWVV